MRWRRSAWAVLDVAAHRVENALGQTLNDASSSLQRTLRPRLVLPTGAPTTDLDIGPLALLMVYPAWGLSPDLIQAGLESARVAVRSHSPLAAEAVRLLSDVIVRVRVLRPDSLREDISSKILALEAIVAGRQRDVAGIPAGEAALLRDARHLAGTDPTSPGLSRATVLSDSLRTAQELSQLAATYRFDRIAWQALRRFRDHLAFYGDPEDDYEPGGWQNQRLLTSARVMRIFATRSHSPERWLRRSISAATESAAIVLDRGALPAHWDLEALTEEIGARLDLAEVQAAGDQAEPPDRAVALLRHVGETLDATEGPVWDPEYLNVVLAHRLLVWRLRLMEGDRVGVRHSRLEAARAAGPWLDVGRSDEVERLERLSQVVLPGEEGPTWPHPPRRRSPLD